MIYTHFELPLVPIFIVNLHSENSTSRRRGLNTREIKYVYYLSNNSPYRHW